MNENDQLRALIDAVGITGGHVSIDPPVPGDERRTHWEVAIFLMGSGVSDHLAKAASFREAVHDAARWLRRRSRDHRIVDTKVMEALEGVHRRNGPFYGQRDQMGGRA